MLNPQSNIGVRTAAELVRLRARAAFAIAVRVRHYARMTRPQPLIQGLYAAHLALLLSGVRSLRRLKSTHSALSLGLQTNSQPARARLVCVLAGFSTALATFVAPSLILPDPAHTAKAEEILRLVFLHRRLLPNAKMQSLRHGGVCDLCR